MFKEMENFTISQNCSKIRAFYSPSGQFPQGARKFSERNGFTFNFDIDKYDKIPPRKIVIKHTIAIKELTKINENDRTLKKNTSSKGVYFYIFQNFIQRLSFLRFLQSAFRYNTCRHYDKS